MLKNNFQFHLLGFLLLMSFFPWSNSVYASVKLSCVDTDNGVHPEIRGSINIEVLKDEKVVLEKSLNDFYSTKSSQYIEFYCNKSEKYGLIPAYKAYQCNDESNVTYCNGFSPKLTVKPNASQPKLKGAYEGYQEVLYLDVTADSSSDVSLNFLQIHFDLNDTLKLNQNSVFGFREINKPVNYEDLPEYPTTEDLGLPGWGGTIGSDNGTAYFYVQSNEQLIKAGTTKTFVLVIKNLERGNYSPARITFDFNPQLDEIGRKRFTEPSLGSELNEMFQEGRNFIWSDRPSEQNYYLSGENIKPFTFTTTMQ